MKRGRPRKYPVQKESMNGVNEKKENLISQVEKVVNEEKSENVNIIESAERAEIIADIIRNQVEEVNKLVEKIDENNKTLKEVEDTGYKTQANFDDTWTKMFNLWSCGW